LELCVVVVAAVGKKSDDVCDGDDGLALKTKHIDGIFLPTLLVVPCPKIKEQSFRQQSDDDADDVNIF